MNLIKSSNTTIRMSDAPQGQPRVLLRDGGGGEVFIFGATRLKCVYDENTYKVGTGQGTQIYKSYCSTKYVLLGLCRVP